MGREKLGRLQYKGLQETDIVKANPALEIYLAPWG